MKRILTLFPAFMCLVAFLGCGHNSSSSPCAGRSYTTPSVHVSGTYVYVSAYARNKYADPSASTCTDNTSAYDLVMAMSTDSGETWSTKTVKQAVSPSSQPIYLSSQAVASDSINRIFISYIDSSYNLYCARSSDAGGTWSHSRVESTANITVTDHAMIVDSSNRLFIVFTAHNSVNGIVTLKYAKSTDNGATWTTNDIDTTDQAGYRPSISLDASNYLHVSYYYAQTYGGLRYAKSINGGTSWTLKDVKVNDGTVSGHLNSISATSGAIYIAFYNPLSYTTSGSSYTENKDGIIQVMKSVDNGTTWTGPVTVDSTTYTGKAPSIASNGNSVFLSYGYYEYDTTTGLVTNNKLKFASSTDGAATFTVQTTEIDSNLSVNYSSSDLSYLGPSMTYYISNVSGRLYLTYAGSGGEYLNFKTSTSGTTWSNKNLSL